MSKLCTYFWTYNFARWLCFSKFTRILTSRIYLGEHTHGSSEFIDHFGPICVDVGCVCVFASLGFLSLCDIGMLRLCAHVFFHVYKIQIGIVVVVVMTTPRNLLTFSSLPYYFSHLLFALIKYVAPCISGNTSNLEVF
jgi:hypothetical protein